MIASVCITLVYTASNLQSDNGILKIILAEVAETIANISEDESFIDALLQSEVVASFMMQYMDWNSTLIYEGMPINHHLLKVLSFVGNCVSLEKSDHV